MYGVHSSELFAWLRIPTPQFRCQCDVGYAGGGAWSAASAGYAPWVAGACRNGVTTTARAATATSAAAAVRGIRSRPPPACEAVTCAGRPLWPAAAAAGDDDADGDSVGVPVR